MISLFMTNLRHRLFFTKNLYFSSICVWYFLLFNAILVQNHYGFDTCFTFLTNVLMGSLVEIFSCFKWSFWEKLLWFQKGLQCFLQILIALNLPIDGLFCHFLTRIISGYYEIGFSLGAFLNCLYCQSLRFALV